MIPQCKLYKCKDLSCKLYDGLVNLTSDNTSKHISLLFNGELSVPLTGPSTDPSNSTWRKTLLTCRALLSPLQSSAFSLLPHIPRNRVRDNFTSKCISQMERACTCHPGKDVLKLDQLSHRGSGNQVVWSFIHSSLNTSFPSRLSYILVNVISLGTVQTQWGNWVQPCTITATFDSKAILGQKKL